MSNMKTVVCSDHGERHQTFVCKHLVEGKGLGFYTPVSSDSEDDAEDDSDDQEAWCSECEKVRQQHGGWNELSEQFAGITLICDVCFEAARARNFLGTK